MPIHEFECENCSTITERILGSEDNILITECKYCGRAARRIVSKCAFVLKGEGWSEDGYDPCKKGMDHLKQYKQKQKVMGVK